GISIVEEGRVLEECPLTAAHDPTEGGIRTGVQEICRRSGLGAVLREEDIPVREETRLLCARYGMDPLGLLSSGVFLFTAAPGDAERACGLLRERGIPAAHVGRMLEAGDGVWLEKSGERQALAWSEQDEMVKLEAAGAAD
ncbi:MAG TPA: AIR synthase-related protein, partial [Spirochaetia bacterium]|nr:AIR synthase-related protein [Spirochaetia bacterium]